MDKIDSTGKQIFAEQSLTGSMELDRLTDAFWDIDFTGVPFWVRNDVTGCGSAFGREHYSVQMHIVCSREETYDIEIECILHMTYFQLT